ncbi:MAG: hypothetical protein QW393_00215 [Candidatus Micrarchaeaceae archaeon]
MNKEKKVMEFAQLDREFKQESEAFKCAMKEGNLNEALTHLEKALMIERPLLKNLLEKLESMGVKVVNKDEAKATDDAFNRALEGFYEAKKNYNEAIKNDSDEANGYLGDEIIHLMKALNIMNALVRKAQDKVNDSKEDSIKAIKRS